MFFVIFKAPDLALTQLVIETISVALFLLAFKHLPALNNHGETKPNKLVNLIIAAGVGITVTLVALSAHSQKLIPSISQYYKDTVATEAGGGNIVNVILVDYRGFDTLFEIAVLSIAGIGVLAMIRLKTGKKGGVRMKTNDVILQTTTKARIFHHLPFFHPYFLCGTLYTRWRLRWRFADNWRNCPPVARL